MSICIFKYIEFIKLQCCINIYNKYIIEEKKNEESRVVCTLLILVLYL